MGSIGSQEYDHFFHIKAGGEFPQAGTKQQAKDRKRNHFFQFSC
jgi:hypothetical protein